MNKKQCSSCTICIGPEFMETISYPVGEYEICSRCYNSLKKNGYAELDGRFGNRCDWLYPDGSVVRMQMFQSYISGVRFAPVGNGKEET